MPYRIDITNPRPDTLDVLVDLGALDLDTENNGVAAILPDSVTQERVANAFGEAGVTVSAAIARDDGSVWLLNPSPVHSIRLADSSAFGTGHHPSTALCVEALEETVCFEQLESMLDVGTGTGILALVALKMGVPRAVGVDVDADALAAAAENARLNRMEDRLELILGGPGGIEGSWPLIVANILAAPLIGMAPFLVKRLKSGGWLILSGIYSTLEPEVRQAYQHLGIRQMAARRRGGWTALIGRASW